MCSLEVADAIIFGVYTVSCSQGKGLVVALASVGKSLCELVND